MFYLRSMSSKILVYCIFETCVLLISHIFMRHTTSYVQDIFVTTVYTDVSGAVKTRTINSRKLSASWAWKNPDEDYQTRDDGPVQNLSP